MRLLALCSLVLWASANMGAQDVEEIAKRTGARLKDKPVTLHGGLNFTGTYADFQGSQPRYDRYGYTVGANLNFDILGVNAPFSLYYSDKNVLYRLPSYQFAGISPSYRWAKVHLGDRNLNFSRYTYANQTFRGAGIELTPKQWTVRAMAGRLRTQSLMDVGARSGLEDSYRRMGYAGEVGYRANTWQLKAIVFAAKDQLPEEVIATPLSVAPEANVVASLHGSAQLPAGIILETEYARSYFTSDITAAAVPDSFGLPSRPLQDRLSTQAADVIRVGLRQNIFRVGYERIAPGYRSLGILFLQDDRDNITAGATFALPRRRAANKQQGGTSAGAATPPAGNTWTISIDAGLERNGISELSLDRGRRIIGRALVNGRIGKRLGLNASFSNFSATSRLRGFLDPTTSTDSVFIAQVNRQAQLGASYMVVEGGAGTLTGQLSITDVSTLRDGRLDGYGNTVTSAYLGYAHQYPQSGFGYSAQGLYAVTAAGPASQTTYGPSVGLNYALPGTQLRVQTSAALTFVQFDEIDQRSQVLNVQPSLTYALERFGNVVLTYTHTARRLGAQGNFTENLVSLRYGWTF